MGQYKRVKLNNAKCDLHIILAPGKPGRTELNPGSIKPKLGEGVGSRGRIGLGLTLLLARCRLENISKYKKAGLIVMTDIGSN